MKYIYIYIVLIGSLLTIGLSSCKGKKQTSNNPNQKIETPDGFSNGGIDEATTQLLIDKADHIDIIFHKLPLSMNQDGKNAVFQELSYISKEPMTGIPVGCYPLARKIYLGDGEILLESDLYFTEECLFQIFIKDEQPLFGNRLSQQGVNFVANLMEQAKQSMPKDVKETYSIPQVN